MRLSRPLWLVLCAAALPAQQGGLTVFYNEIEIHFETKLEPPGNQTDRFPDGVVIDREELQAPGRRRVHRTITDVRHGSYFGYDLVMESLPDPQAVRLRVEPLTVASVPQAKLLAPPKFPVIPLVHVGETVALDLLVNPATGQKIVDYLSVRRNSSKTSPGSEAPHDFALEDVNLELQNPRVWVDGKLIEDSAQGYGGTVAAHVLWIALRGGGSFEISLWPEPGLGFKKAGVVSGKTITFREGSSEYRVESAVQIAPGSGPFNAYVSRDSAWRGRDFAWGGSDKAGMIHAQ